jgi:hypothetical protein
MSKGKFESGGGLEEALIVTGKISDPVEETQRVKLSLSASAF